MGTQKERLCAVELMQGWLRDNKLDGFVIPSTDHFLSEFAPPAYRRLRWLTGFRGSTGMAIVLQEHAALFLDGRYLRESAAELNGSLIEVRAAGLASRREWLKRCLGVNAKLAVDPWLHSVQEMEQWQALADELKFKLEYLGRNPVDELWAEDRPAYCPTIVDYPTKYSGESYESKCKAIAEHLAASGLEALFVPDPEDVSWLLNVRATGDTLKTAIGDWHVVPSCASRVLVRRDGTVSWFVEKEQLAQCVLERTDDFIRVASPDGLREHLSEVSNRGVVGADLRRTSVALASEIPQDRLRADDVIARHRWRKHPTELQAARHIHAVDAAAVIRFMAWLTAAVRERPITELDAAKMLEAFRSEHPMYRGPSMPLMASSGSNGALPHHTPHPEHPAMLNDHPIFWIDSGGQYLGGSTDNTITLALGTAEPKHIRAHTLVLQGFIAYAMARFPVGTPAFRLDTIARQALWHEGMDFGHGTGHGVGNYLNIHEAPLVSRELIPITSVHIEPGMIVTNEPGYYASGDFGLRIESHMIAVQSRYPGFLEFEVISRLPIDPRLVDFERLSPPERRWLANYHRTVLDDVGPLLDPVSQGWLQEVATEFLSRAK